MPEKNVEVVERMTGAFLAGDVTTALEVLDDEVVWHGTIGGLDEGRIARGHREVIEGFSENLKEWESHVLEARQFIEAGHERVVVFWHEEGRGRSSGVEVTTDTAVIYTVRGGHIVEAQGYMDRSAALKAAGLEE